MASVAIEARQLTRRFGSFVAVDHVSFQVHEGEIFGYLGANGAGKSTTIRMLCGLLAPSEGEAWVAGVNVGKQPEKVKRRIGYMSQKFSLYPDLSVQENIEFFGGSHGLFGRRLREREQAVVEAVGLDSMRHEKTGDLPGGWRQRVALACALLHEPALLFLDEPTAGVDPASRRDFWKLVRERAAAGTTILVTTHYMDEAEYCDRLGLMVDGRLAALGTPHELKRQHVPGTIWEVRGPSLPGLEHWQHPAIEAAEHFGNALHVRIRPGTSAVQVQELKHWIGQQPGPVSIEPVEATLEDVFLEVVRVGMSKPNGKAP